MPALERGRCFVAFFRRVATRRRFARWPPRRGGPAGQGLPYLRHRWFAAGGARRSEWQAHPPHLGALGAAEIARLDFLRRYRRPAAALHAVAGTVTPRCSRSPGRPRPAPTAMVLEHGALGASPGARGSTACRAGAIGAAAPRPGYRRVLFARVTWLTIDDAARSFVHYARNTTARTGGSGSPVPRSTGGPRTVLVVAEMRRRSRPDSSDRFRWTRASSQRRREAGRHRVGDRDSGLLPRRVRCCRPARAAAVAAAARWREFSGGRPGGRAGRRALQPQDRSRAGVGPTSPHSSDAEALRAEWLASKPRAQSATSCSARSGYRPPSSAATSSSEARVAGGSARS